MTSVLQDVRNGLRVLAKAPAFTAVTVLTMAVGTGANATVFSFVSALLLRPAPGVAHPSSLVAIFTADAGSGLYGPSSYPDFLSLAEGTSAFTGMAAEEDDSTGVVRVGDVVERVRISAVTGDYFHVLGLEASAGRLISPMDTEAGAAPVAVLAHRFWGRAFGADPAMPGSTIMVNGRAHTVIGVAPERFTGLHLGRWTDVWTALLPPPGTAAERGNRRLSVIARLGPGSRMAEAGSQVSTVAARLAQSYPETNRGVPGAPDAPRRITAQRHTRLPPQFRDTVTALGAILMSAVGLVLLIACANIASLLLSRATARDREMAVRLALGAGRLRVIRLMLTESLILGLAGGGLGLLFSLWTADLLPSFFPEDQARMLDTTMDSMTILYVILLSIASSVLFGLAPALHAAAPSSAAALRSGPSAGTDSRRRARLRRVLVSAQVALAVILLVGAALLTRSVLNGTTADPGFGTRNALLASVELPEREFAPEQGLRYYQLAVDRVRQVRGIEAASFARTMPTSRHAREILQIEGYEPQPGESMELHTNIVGAEYFEAMRIPIRAGRTFEVRDRPGSAPVAIVNALLAARYFGDRAVGRHLTGSSGQTVEIVGVVGNTVDLTVQSPRVPIVYYPLAQRYVPRMTLIARTAGDPMKFAEAIRRELVGVNRNVPVFRTVSLSAHMGEASADSRLTAALVGACGVMALLLAAIGVYGVIAHAVARRQREIGVRLALGARPWHIVHLVLNEGLTVTVTGIVLGLAGAALSARTLESMLYGVTASDPLTYALVPAILALVAAAAACAPARRAISVEPTAVLRHE